MAGIYVTGMASGLDWDSIVTKIMTLNRTPENTMKMAVSVDGAQKSFWSGINADMNSLSTSINALRRIGGDVFNSKSAVSSDTTVTSAYIKDSSTPASSYNISVSNLASYAIKNGGELFTDASSAAAPAELISSDSIGTISESASIASQTAGFGIDPGVSGTMLINSVSVNWNSSDSLNDIAARINSSAAGVTASYDEASGKFSVFTNTSGATSKLSISETSGNLLEALNITPGNAVGSNASITNTGAAFASGSTNTDRQVTGGIFTINNVKFMVDTSVDSISGLLSKINSSSAGVTATYDKISNSISIVSSKSGAASKVTFGSATDTSNFLYAMKLSDNTAPVGGASDTYSGTDAMISINGAASVARDSNTVDGLIPGMTVTLNGMGNSTISVSVDRDAISAAVSDFVDKYNAVMTKIDDSLNEDQVKSPTTADEMYTGSFKGNSTLISLKQKLSDMVTSVSAGMPSDMNMLEQVGISLKATSDYKGLQLNFDATKFNQAVNLNFDKVKQLFSSDTGFAQTAYTQINTLTSSTGPITAEVKSLDTKVSQTNDQITEFEARMVTEEAQLRQEFTQMETAISNMKNQASWLSGMLGTSTSSSSTSSTSSSTSTSS
jgi:flagellar hook-associated protein 2